MSTVSKVEFTHDDFEGAVEELLATNQLITSRRVADKVGCSRELARQYLVKQTDRNRLTRDRVGGGAVVYRLPESGYSATKAMNSSCAPADRAASSCPSLIPVIVSRR